MTDEQLGDLKYALYMLYDMRYFYGSLHLSKKALFDGVITMDEFNQLCGDYVLEEM